MTKPTEFNKNGSERDQSNKERMAAIKSRGKPLGGAPPVKIPPLNAEPIPDPETGRPIPMEQQADILRDPRSPLSPYYDPNLADTAAEVAREQASNMDPQRLRMAREASGGEPMSKTTKGPFGPTLPPEAAQDPAFRPGVGSAYAANQPGLGKTPQPGRKQLSEETVEGLQALSEFQAKAAETQEKVVEEAAKEHVDDEASRREDALGLADEFYDELRRRRQSLDTEELREAIEKRCEEMTIDQLIEDGELRQVVPIVRDKLLVEFRTVSGEEDLGMKRELYKERNAPDIYLFDKLNMMQLAAGLYSINNKPLPDHLNERRRFDPKAFEVKFNKVQALPLPFLASLSINYTWFDHRARKLFVDLDSLKNG